MDNNFKYQPLDEKDLNISWGKHKKIIEAFIARNGYNTDNVYVNEKIIMAIIAKVHQRRKYFEYFHGLDMSECKEVALTSFWYIKMKPICAITKEVMENDLRYFDSINEKLAVYNIIVALKGMLRSQGMSIKKIDELSENYIKELIYSFTYRDISKEALILLVESMAVFLGLNPYNNTVMQ